MIKELGVEEIPIIRKSAVFTLHRAPGLGRLPEVILFGSLGLFLVALAFVSSLAGTAWAELFYWLGLALMILPVAYRLFAKTVSRQERIGLLVFLGLGLYLVKVMHSPAMFTFSDELLHFRNADNILRSGTLFAENTILPVSSNYPGLESITIALATLSGLSLFASGVVIIGVARLIMILALYLFFEQVGRSGRVAGLAVLLYTTNSNFVYWIAQYSYESLALSLGVLVLYTLAKWSRTKDRYLKRSLAIAMIILISTVIITHHVTSYAVLVFLIAFSIVSSLLQYFLKSKQPNSWGLALVAGVLTLSWLVLVASSTQYYLYQIFKSAFASVVQLFTGEDTGRALFTSTTGVVAPLWERMVGIGSVLLTMFGILLGIFALWRRKRFNPFPIVLAGAALFYFVMLGLRFTGAGWEISNRASEFLFVGISFLLAFGFFTLRLAFPKLRSLLLVFMSFTVVLFFGGVIAGWSPALRLTKPLLVSVNNTIIPSQGLEAADWMLAMSGPDNNVIAPTSNALLMLAYGRQQAVTGNIYAVRELLTTQHSLVWQTDTLQWLEVRYIVIDHRKISWDGMQGSYFNPRPTLPLTGNEFYPPEIFTMFDEQTNLPRIYDSGDVVIYDVGGPSGVTQTK